MLGTIHSAFGQIGYTHLRSFGSLASNHKSGDGVYIEVLLPIPKSRFYLGLGASNVFFTTRKPTQLYTLPTDPILNTDMKVGFGNWFATMFLNCQYDLINKGRIRPYLNLSLVHFWTNSGATIKDMNKNDLYEYVNINLWVQDKIVAGKFGLGTRILTNHVLHEDIRFPLFIDFGVYYTAGMSNYRYRSHNLPQQQSSQSADFKVFEADFVNTQTQAVQKLAVGYQYTSPIRMLEFKVGVGYLFGKVSNFPNKKKSKYKKSNKNKQPKNKEKPKPKRIYTH
jgi:hypothetical protein